MQSSPIHLEGLRERRREALPETVRRNGVPVVFEGVLRPDIPTTVMIGTVIEITRIERRR